MPRLWFHLLKHLSTGQHPSFTTQNPSFTTQNPSFPTQNSQSSPRSKKLRTFSPTFETSWVFKVALPVHPDLSTQWAWSGKLLGRGLAAGFAMMIRVAIKDVVDSQRQIIRDCFISEDEFFRHGGHSKSCTCIVFFNGRLGRQPPRCTLPKHVSTWIQCVYPRSGQ